MTSAVAMAGLGLASGGFSAYSQHQAGKKTQKGYDYNADIAEQEAGLIRTGADIDERRSRKQLGGFVSRQIASYGSSGVELTGSPLDVISDTIASAEMDIAINRFNSNIAERRKLSEAGMLRYYGAEASKTATTQAIGTFLSSAGSAALKFSGGSAKSGSASSLLTPKDTGYNPPTASQLTRPGAFTRIKP